MTTFLPRSRARGVVYGLIGAALFGAGAPLSRLVGDVDHLVLSVLVYVGAAIGLSLLTLVRPSRWRALPQLARADLPLVSILVVTTSLAQLFQIIGTARVAGDIGALALSLQLPLTAVIAVAFFRDRFNILEVIGVLVVCAGVGLLGLQPGSGTGDALGMTFIAISSVAWALDSNLTQRLSGRDPLALARLKAVVAAGISLPIMVLVGAEIPGDPAVLTKALGLGLVCFGIPEILIISSIRHLGATRAEAVSATAPFAGAFIAIPALGVLPSRATFVMAGVIAAGLWCLLWGASRAAAERRTRMAPTLE
ncbi:MAG TPA: DMT family transporter [Kofleriaceae bacterium]